MQDSTAVRSHRETAKLQQVIGKLNDPSELGEALRHLVDPWLEARWSAKRLLGAAIKASSNRRPAWGRTVAVNCAAAGLGPKWSASVEPPRAIASRGLEALVQAVSESRGLAELAAKLRAERDNTTRKTPDTQVS